MYAHLGHGAALLRRGRPGDAACSFRSALTHYPGHPLPSVGLAVAEGSAFAVDSIANPMTRGLAAGALGRESEAAALLAESLDAAPPGFTGWWPPAEPFLHQSLGSQALKAVMRRVGDRAR